MDCTTATPGTLIEGFYYWSECYSDDQKRFFDNDIWHRKVKQTNYKIWKLWGTVLSPFGIKGKTNPEWIRVRFGG